MKSGAKETVPLFPAKWAQGDGSQVREEEKKVGMNSQPHRNLLLPFLPAVEPRSLRFSLEGPAADALVRHRYR